MQKDSNRQQAPLETDSLRSLLRLSLIPGVGPRIRTALIEHFGSAENVLQSSSDQLHQVQGVGTKLSQKILRSSEEIDPDEEINLCAQNNIAILTDLEERYPKPLREIPDPPAVLYHRGEFLPQDTIAIAIVGTRHATQYGLVQAERLSGELSRAGFTIISGLARGIDSKAHQGALNAGGRTIAVLGSGLLSIYPPENRQLANEVAQNGVLLSESPPRSKPLSGSFPQRNRIITGLSLGVIVVEAADRSGALISARHAMEQNREVFAVPGRIDSRTSRGCHRLLRDGAKLVETADDVLEELGPLSEATPSEAGLLVCHPAELQLNDQEKKVLAVINHENTGIDQIALDSGLPVGRVLSTLSVLEIRRLIRRVSGSSVIRI